MRRGWASAGVAVIVVACGGGGLSLTEYAAQSEHLVRVLIERIDAADAEWKSQVPTVERAQTHLDNRIEAREALLETLQSLDPPQQIADIHEAALDRFIKLNAAESALAARVAAFETDTDLEQMWETPEGRAALAALDDVIDFCIAAQAEMDATQYRETFADLPWIPPEMKETVRVAFACS